MDLQCPGSHSTNFALSHSITLSAILLSVMLSVNLPCPASQPTGFWMTSKGPFKDECNICHLPFLWCLTISTAAVVLYWIGQQFQVWVPSELLSETVWSQQSFNITFIVLSKNLFYWHLEFWRVSEACPLCSWSGAQLEWSTAGVKSNRTARTGWMGLHSQRLSHTDHMAFLHLWQVTKLWQQGGHWRVPRSAQQLLSYVLQGWPSLSSNTVFTFVGLNL